MSPVRLHPRLATVLNDKGGAIYFAFISSEQSVASCAEAVQVLMVINIYSLTYSILSSPAFCLPQNHRVTTDVMTFYCLFIVLKVQCSLSSCWGATLRSH